MPVELNNTQFTSLQVTIPSFDLTSNQINRPESVEIAQTSQDL